MNKCVYSMERKSDGNRERERVRKRDDCEKELLNLYEVVYYKPQVRFPLLTRQMLYVQNTMYSFIYST